MRRIIIAKTKNILWKIHVIFYILICIQGPTMISQLSHRNLEIYTKDIFKVYCRKVWDEKLIK